MQKKKLKKICLYITDGSHYSPQSVENGLPIASVKDMNDYGINLNTCRKISFEEFSMLVKNNCQPEVGDVLIAKDGSYLKHAFVVEEDPQYVILSSIGLFRPDKTLMNPYYLKYLFLNSHFRDYVMKGFVSGTALKRIVLTAFKEININVPNIKQQEEIVGKIKPLDDKIKSNIDLIKNLEEYCQLMFYKWFVAYNFPNEGGKPYSDSGGEMVEIDGIAMPKGWEYGPFTKLGKFVGGGTPSTSNEEYYTNQGIPWLTPKDLSDKPQMYTARGERDISELGLRNSSAVLIPSRSVLMSSRAPIGYLTIAKNPLSTNQGFKSFVPNDDRYSEFIYFSLQNKMNRILISSSGSTFSEVSKGMMEKLITIIPDEKTLIQYYELSKPIFDKIDMISEEQQLLIQARDLFIKKLIK